MARVAKCASHWELINHLHEVIQEVQVTTCLNHHRNCECISESNNNKYTRHLYGRHWTLNQWITWIKPCPCTSLPSKINLTKQNNITWIYRQPSNSGIFKRFNYRDSLLKLQSSWWWLLAGAGRSNTSLLIPKRGASHFSWSFTMETTNFCDSFHWSLAPYCPRFKLNQTAATGSRYFTRNQCQKETCNHSAQYPLKRYIL